MQPYFFPYWGHFSLIALTEKWILLDETQYKPKSWMNRNRILHPKTGWQYISVPLSNSTRNIKTYQAKILDPISSKISIKRKLEHYKKTAPFFSSVLNLVDKAFDHVDTNNSLTSLCHGSILVVCEYLGIKIDSIKSSELNVNYPLEINAGEWAPYITHHLKLHGYINPIGGSFLFDQSKFRKLGLDLKFMANKDFMYNQGPYDFNQNLSILDSLMWLEPEKVKRAIEENVEILSS